MECVLCEINYDNATKESTSSADPLNFHLYDRKRRDELHNNQTKHVQNRPSCLLKYFNAPFTNDEFRSSYP